MQNKEKKLMIYIVAKIRTQKSFVCICDGCGEIISIGQPERAEVASFRIMQIGNHAQPTTQKKELHLPYDTHTLKESSKTDTGICTKIADADRCNR